MNERIILNLYELWEQIGEVTGNLIKKEDYKAVTMQGSDWPNRIFELNNNSNVLNDIVKLNKQRKISNIIAIPDFINCHENQHLEFIMSQINMAIDLKLISNKFLPNQNIIQVNNTNDAIAFAETASNSFGYNVDAKVIDLILKNIDNIKLFLYKEAGQSLGCGIVYFDSNNNAGLHMIGTLPEGRGKGIGRSITERLLFEASQNNCNICVLHASSMGESIYRKLGFESFGEIKTYRIRN